MRCRKGTLVSATAPCPLPMGKGVAKSCFGEDTSLDRSGLTHPPGCCRQTPSYTGRVLLLFAVAACWCGASVLPEQQ